MHRQPPENQGGCWLATILLTRLLLLLLLLLLAPPVPPVSAALQDRTGALIGYREESVADRAACPPDKLPKDCPGWAPAECLRNPSYMRANCAASCKIVARCFGSMTSTPWGGHATAAGTARFAAKLWPAAAGAKAAAPGHFRQHTLRYSGVDGLGAHLTLSSLGVGTYLGAKDAATDEAVTNAVIKSVAEGWNVVDTAATYRGGRGEVSVGHALHALRVLDGAERDMLFISTKAGYPPDGLLDRLLQAGAISPADVAGGYHSMHPAFLRASLDNSLASLGLATVDLLFIHNPAESQLELLGGQAFMSRLRHAFQFCEQARVAGQIKAYGIASWSCFRVPPGDSEHLNLQSVVQLAAEVGGSDHGFRYIQLPISAGMPEAWAQPWQEMHSGSGGSGGGGSSVKPVTVMQAASELGLGVFSSGPLMEAELLKDARLARAVQAVPQLQNIQSTAPRLLQLARSTPGLLSTLVGHKTPANVDHNCALTQVPPLSQPDFLAAFGALPPQLKAAASQ